MLKRPSPDEGEEDILRMQKEYLQEKEKNADLRPAAQVTNLRATAQDKTPHSPKVIKSRKTSKYAQLKGLKNEKRVRFESTTGAVMGDILSRNFEEQTNIEKDEDTVYYPKVMPSVLSNIEEKNTHNDEYLSYRPMPAQAFPIAVKCDLGFASGSNTPLYMEGNASCPKMDVNSKYSYTTNLPDKSYIVSSEEADGIHNENINLLSKMTENEIMEEQQKLVTELDPNLIKFLKAKRKNDDPISLGDNDSKCQKLDDKDTETIDTTWDNDVISHPDINKWLHFNSLEKDKLEWLKGIEESNIVTPDKPYEARFDFKGYLLPYTIPYTEQTKSLFHHGDEPHRPGYTLSELFELTRSTVTQQRVFALTTIAGILEYYFAGTYKGVIEIPLSKILFVLRFALDDKAEGIIQTALKGLRNLIYNRIDEATLDSLLGLEAGIQQPYLENDKSEIAELDSHESELKDFHLAEIDIITAMLRTDILTRIQYILYNTRPNINCVQYSMQILTRLARDSPETALKIMEKEYLMYSIKDVISSTNHDNTHHQTQLAAMRLLRILALQSKEIGEMLVTKYSFLEPVMQYINIVPDRTNAVRVQIEAYSVMSNLLKFGLATEKATTLFPIVLSTLNVHVQNTDVISMSTVLNIIHAAVVLQFTSCILKITVNVDDSNRQQLYMLLKEGATKWLSQVGDTSESYTSGRLRLACAIMDVWSTIIVIDKTETTFLKISLRKLAYSSEYAKIVSHLEASSNLLSGIKNKDLHLTKNLMSLGTLVVNSELKLLPILSTVSPVPFMASLFKLLDVLNDEILMQLYIEKLKSYINKLATTDLSLINNWFTRTETDLVMSIMRIAEKIDISDSKKDSFYIVAYKMCYTLREGKTKELWFIFDSIIFNRKWLTAERLMNQVSLREDEGYTRATTLIRELTRKIVAQRYNKMGYNLDDIALRKWQEPILPRDWMYLPILDMCTYALQDKTCYGLQTKNLKVPEDKESKIKACLEWVLFNESCFPELLEDVSVTDRFCRIMCMFLCDNASFLEPQINTILQKCVQILFKKKDEFNFNQRLIGLSDFQGLYTQFLEHFQAVSYGDYTFAACVLVPLAQRHDVKWRKLIWSEYAGCLRALDCPADRMCYELKDHLYPEETDESLIRSYQQALVSNLVRPGTVAYAIADHHVTIWKRKINR